MFRSKLFTFLIVRVNKESFLGFFDCRRFLYLPYNLVYRFAVQPWQTLRPQLTDRVCLVPQFLHSMTTKSVPQLLNLSANRTLRDLRELVKADSKSFGGIVKGCGESAKANPELPTLMFAYTHLKLQIIYVTRLKH
jgi:hypothetical protein